MFDDPNLSNEKCRSQYLYDKLFRSKLTIARTFKKEEGITISQYYISVRVERAQMMLKDIKYSIEDIVVALRYKNKELFFKQFKQATGTTPKAYRDAYLSSISPKKVKKV